MHAFVFHDFGDVLMHPDDPLHAVKALAANLLARETELRRSLVDLEKRLRDAVGASRACGSSDNCTLATYDDDDAVYGYLFFDGEHLRVAHRTTEEDLQDHLNHDHYGPTFSISDHGACPIAWVHAVTDPKVLASLLASIQQTIRETTERSLTGVRAITSIASVEIRDLDTAIESAASSLNYPLVIANWRSAQSAVGIDPADAATRACQLVETVCKHILVDCSTPLPTNQSIQHPLKAVARTLSLSPDQQTSHDLQQIASGMFTAVAGIGALRTHVGTSHGSSPGGHSLSASEARFAVNCAGTTAAFLMDALVRHKARSNQPPTV